MSAGRRPFARPAARPEATAVVLAIGAAIGFALAGDRFLTGDNFGTILPFIAPFAMLAAGQVLVMGSGHIDLSIGSVFVFSPFVFERAVSAGLPLAGAVLLTLACCAAIGVVNGLFTCLLNVPSFITTLGTLLAVGGLTLVVSGSAPVAMPGTEAFRTVFGAGTAVQVAWALGTVAFVQVVLTTTRWGRHTLAVGGNLRGSAELGIRVHRVVVRNFAVCSLIAGLVGLLEAVRTGTAAPDTAAGAETMFRALSAAVIGGTMLRGGRATAVGALFGAIFLGVLRDGLTLHGVDADALDLILGCVLLLAVAAGAGFSNRVATVRA